MTLKGAAIAGIDSSIWDALVLTVRFYHFVGESEGDVQVLTMYLHGVTFLMCLSIILGRRLNRFKKIVHRKVKCRYKQPAFRDHYHHSFATRFRKIGFKTLFILPRKLESNHWIRSIKFWKPGWHVRLKVMKQQWTRQYRMLTFGYWEDLPIVKTMTTRQWDDPLKRTVLDTKEFANVCGICDATTLDTEQPNQGPRLTSVSCESATVNIFQDLGTRKGRRRMVRTARRAAKSFQVFVTTNNAKLERNGVYNMTSGKRRYSAADFGIIWDTGASQTVTFSKEDFTTGIDYYATPQNATGIAAGLEILGKGMVRWDISMNDGTVYPIAIEALYCPSANRRLLCPQQLKKFLSAQNSALSCTMSIENHHIRFQHGKHQIYAEYDTQTNLPMSYGRTSDCLNLELSVNEINACLTDHANQNLSKAQKELLRLHYRFGHISMQRIQTAIRGGQLATTQEQKVLHMAASKCDTPKCAACEFAKAKKRSLPGQHSRTVDDLAQGTTKHDKLFPGDQIAMDHFICSTRGRLFGSAGKTVESSMYKGAAIFVDAATGFIHVEFQVGLTADETLLAKERFEHALQQFNITPKEYRFDNGSAFISQKFTQHLVDQKQQSTFAGVGAHSQNGVAERSIQTVVSMARTMMIHAAIHWPGVHDTCLWPMAVAHATYIHNRMPRRDTGLSPYELLSRTNWERKKLLDLHVWGCPTYVLDPRVQDGKQIPRWTPRSRRGQYMGNSPRHASTVPLILNLLTHRINAQFHCVFDDWFSTVDMNLDEVPNFDSDQWTYLFGESKYQYPFDPDDGEIPRLDNEYTDEYYDSVMQKRDRQPTTAVVTHSSLPTHQRESQPPEADPTSAAPTTPVNEEFADEVVADTTAEMIPATPTPSTTPTRVTWAPDVAPAPELQPERRRSTRSNLGQFTSTKFHDEVFNMLYMEPDPTPLGLEFICGIYAASVSDPDTLSYQEAMRASDSHEFKQAASKEIADLVKQGTWKIVRKADAKGKILPGIWVFRRKRNPGTGAITKYKGRYTVRGDLQEGIFDTFAPVVQWSTIRMLMAISLKYGYHTRSIDFSSAFVQAKLDKPVWIHLPRGRYPEQFGEDVEDKCLELQKSLYGLSVAPKLWYEHLRERLIARGFKASKLDPCLFYRNQVAIAVYVDDLVMISKHKKILDDIVAELRSEFTITDEGTLSTYLGIVVERQGDQFKLSQPELTRKVIQAVGLTDAKPNARPASETLGSHLDCDKHNETWEYASIIGMLMYLSTNSRPDIAFAVHQCARFTHDPRAPHSVAVKQIIRYLKGTEDKGLIMKLSNTASVDCYVDADFCGGFKKNFDLQDPATSKSRTGYVIYVFGIPICWGSKLQHEVALSTMEAEYVALSQATREVLALRNLLTEMGAEMEITKDLTFLTKSTVFEDNAGCIVAAKAPHMTARSKHYHTKYHFFKHHIRTDKNPNGVLDIEKIDTTKQVADIFTKPLDAVTFKTVRALLMGW